MTRPHPNEVRVTRVAASGARLRTVGLAFHGIVLTDRSFSPSSLRSVIFPRTTNNFLFPRALTVYSFFLFPSLSLSLFSFTRGRSPDPSWKVTLREQLPSASTAVTRGKYSTGSCQVYPRDRAIVRDGFLLREEITSAILAARGKIPWVSVHFSSASRIKLITRRGSSRDPHVSLSQT